VERPVVTETTALGVAILAGLQIGIFKSTQDVQKQWQCDRTFEVNMEDDMRDKLLLGWKRAVAKVKS